jgi:ribosome biogenesis GTPase
LDLEVLGWDKYFQSQLDSQNLQTVIPGRVFRRSPAGQYDVYTNKGVLTVRVPGRIKNQVLTGAELPGIGDWVLVKPLKIGNVIVKILERKNQISRKAAGKELKEQLIAANIDIMFLVMGLDHDFNLRRLERFIFMVTASQAKPVVILNKIDMVNDLIEKLEKVRVLVGDEIDIHTISALNKSGIDTIRQYMKTGITIVLVGSSGVGKSTIINALLGEPKQKTAEVRKKDSKGRHITTSRELFIIPGGGVIIDNPGIRELQLWGDPSSLKVTFKEIDELSVNCRFRDCAHLNEPGCAVIKALKSGTLSEERFNNYLKMRKELAYLSRKMEMSSEAAEKLKWKGLVKNAKHYRKYKKNR